MRGRNRGKDCAAPVRPRRARAPGKPRPRRSQHAPRRRVPSARHLDRSKDRSALGSLTTRSSGSSPLAISMVGAGGACSTTTGTRWMWSAGDDQGHAQPAGVIEESCVAGTDEHPVRRRQWVSATWAYMPGQAARPWRRGRAPRSVMVRVAGPSAPAARSTLPTKARPENSRTVTDAARPTCARSEPRLAAPGRGRVHRIGAPRS